MSMPAMCLNKAMFMCELEPMLEVPCVKAPGCAFAILIISLTDRAGKEGCATSTTGTWAIIATGAKSCMGSYGNLP